MLKKMLKLLVRVPGKERLNNKPLTKVIIELCEDEGILGATVIQCLYGYGEKEYKAGVLRGVGELPIIIEIIDDPIIIYNFIPKLKEIVKDKGLITIEEVFTL